jgi:arylsulfatase A-like enzyme
MGRAAIRTMAVALTAIASALACERESPASAERSAPAPPPATTEAPEAQRQALPLLGKLDHCDVLHGGFLLDLGTTAPDSEREFAVGPFDDVVPLKHGGASFGAMRSRRVGYTFWVKEPARDVHVALRAKGGVARQVSVYLDRRRLGVIRLSREEARVASLSGVEVLEPGLHTVSLAFSGTARSPEDTFAEIDWLLLGQGEPVGPQYAAPTRERLIADVVLDGAPRRSVAVRAPGSIRCPLRVVRGARLEVDVGFWGTGKGTADIRILAPGADPVVLVERKVIGGHGATWSRISLPLAEFESRVVGLELRATAGTSGGRVAFGEPAIVVEDPTTHGVPPARVVVVVVAAGLNRRVVPPWGSAVALPSLGLIARRGAAFDGYRAPTTVASGVMATLLTGLSPSEHTLEDPLTRLPNEIRAIGEIIKEADGRAAMFTGVPTSTAAFGFDRGWSRYDAYSPVRDLPATEPIEQATAWLRGELEDATRDRTLVVVHARGGHPPWDLSREEAAALPPKEYGGTLEPRQGAITLANLRASRTTRSLSAEEWQRLRALEIAALRKQDRALHGLINVLEEHRNEAPYLLVLMGDVAPGDPPHLPFAPTPPLREDHLMVPLVMVFPDGKFAGARVGSVATTADVTRTVLSALRATVPEGAVGRDLYRAAGGFEPPNGGAHTATLGSAYLTRWGPWLLQGELRRTPTLCQTEVDPACASDVLAQNPIASSGLWRQTYERIRHREPGKPTSREPAVFDPETLAALKVFGYTQ